jgi:hypothetical protein
MAARGNANTTAESNGVEAHELVHPETRKGHRSLPGGP